MAGRWQAGGMQLSSLTRTWPHRPSACSLASMKDCGSDPCGRRAVLVVLVVLVVSVVLVVLVVARSVSGVRLVSVVSVPLACSTPLSLASRARMGARPSRIAEMASIVSAPCPVAALPPDTLPLPRCTDLSSPGGSSSGARM
eukprot:scaffold32958_cov50-Phaeocystis_antarctica.AAC.4